MTTSVAPERHLGRLVVVTGAGRGIGQSIAVRFAAEGARVISVDRSAFSPESRNAVLNASSTDTEHVHIVADVSSPKSIAELIATAHDLGGCDILVNNAALQPFSPLGDITLEQWDDLMEVNVRPLFLLSQGLSAQMRAKGRGRIIAMASTLFHNGAAGAPHYTASKGAVIGLVRALAAELGGDGTTVNAVAPGLVRTPATLEGPHQSWGLFDAVLAQQAIKRTMQPGDLDGTISFLASDDAEMITGQTLVVDGGLVRA